MKMVTSLVIALFLTVASGVASADAIKKTTEMVTNNPGKSVGVAGCIALVILPPAAALCAATLVAGATYDGDTQKILKKIRSYRLFQNQKLYYQLIFILKLIN